MADEQQVVMPSSTDQPPQAANSAVSTAGDDNVLSWQASEYVQHHKTFKWYLGFMVMGITTSMLLFFILRDWFAVVVVVLMFVALFVYAVRKPETLHYQINNDGLTIGNKHYPFDKFRSFSVIQTTGVPSISFEPLLRFSPPISVYCEPTELAKITDALAAYLPQADKQPDVIDRLSHYLRF